MESDRYKIIRRGRKWAIYMDGHTNLTYNKGIGRFLFELLPNKDVRFTRKEAESIVDKLLVVERLK